MFWQYSKICHLFVPSLYFDELLRLHGLYKSTVPSILYICLLSCPTMIDSSVNMTHLTFPHPPPRPGAEQEEVAPSPSATISALCVMLLSPHTALLVVCYHTCVEPSTCGASECCQCSRRYLVASDTWWEGMALMGQIGNPQKDHIIMYFLFIYFNF